MNAFGRFTLAGVSVARYRLLLALLGSLTARAVEIPTEPGRVVSLDGTWRFKLEQAGGKLEAPTPPAAVEPFHRTDYQEGKEWGGLAVPGNWEMAGFSPATYSQPDGAVGLYRFWFDVPQSWAGRLVRLNFDAVQNGAEVWLNGQPVAVDESSWGRMNYHESGWTAFQVELTPEVKFGAKNLLAVRVTKRTRSVALDNGDYFFLGGIHRTVTLFSVPRTHVDDVAVQTRLLPGNRAEVKLRAGIAGVDAASVAMRLEGVAGSATARIENGRAVLTQIVAQPKLWSAEFPNLYNLAVDLKDARGQTTETVAKRIGIREITIQDAVLLVNGVPVKLAGMCRHDVSPTEGTAVGAALWRKDIALMKAANINAIRTSHYPYGAGFYDLCDELGMYVMDEVPYCGCPTDDPETRPAFEQRARETIRRDKNHACVLVWALGNENKQGRNLKVAADLVKQLDPTRPRLVSWLDAAQNDTELSDSHYTAPDDIAKAGKFAKEEGRPHLYLENPNTGDARLGADAGYYERWGAVIQRVWNVCLKYDSIPGTFIFEWQDRAIADKSPVKNYVYFPETGIQLLKMKGLVDGFRNPRPALYEVKMVYSPIRIGDTASVAAGKVSFAVENRYSFTDLSHLKLTWALERAGKPIASGDARTHQPPLSIGRTEFAVTADALAQADALRVGFVHPDGNEVVAHRFVLKTAVPVVRIETTLPAGLPIPQFNLVTRVTQRNPKLWREVLRYPAKLTNIVLEPASATTLAGLKRLTADVVVGPDHQVVGKIRAAYANGEFSYRFEWTSAAPADVQEVGWCFELPMECDRFSWDRAARWTVYPPNHIGRASGTARPDTMKVPYTRMERPDAFDFNSTKYDCKWASLTTAQGAGLRVEFDAKQRFHCRGGAAAGGAGHTLFVNQQVSPADDYVRQVVPEMFLELKPGTLLEGRFRVGANRTIIP